MLNGLKQNRKIAMLLSAALLFTVFITVWGAGQKPVNADASQTPVVDSLKIEKYGVLYLAEFTYSRCYAIRIVNDDVNGFAGSGIGMQCHSSMGPSNSKMTALATVPINQIVEVEKPEYGDICEVAWTARNFNYSKNINEFGPSGVVLECQFGK